MTLPTTGPIDDRDYPHCRHCDEPCPMPWGHADPCPDCQEDR